MKKLLCASDVESAYSENKPNLEVDKDTIITPLAKDLIEKYQLNIEIIEQKETEITDPNNISEELIVAILKKILNGSLNDKCNLRLDSNGLKVVDGSSFKFKDLSNCNGGSGKYCNFSYGKSTKSKFGLIRLDKTEWSDSVKNDINLYISKGDVNISIDKDSCTSKEGDIIFIPKGANVTVKTSKDVELVYSLTE